MNELNYIGVYRDGGTKSFEYRNTIYFLDHRIGSKTKNEWFTGYPNSTNALTSKSLIKRLNYLLPHSNETEVREQRRKERHLKNKAIIDKVIFN